jgi:branched-chain amino acid transport system permease protein
MRFPIAAAAVLALLPFGLPPYAMTLLTEALILGLFAMSLDLMVGYARLISFGHAAAYGFGAYACGNFLLHTSMPLPFAVLLAGFLGGIVAIGVGWVCTQATGVSFSMLTLAYAQLLYAVAFKWTPVTGASDGLAGIPRNPGPFGVTWWSTKAGFYYLVLACLVGAFLFCRELVQSPFGAVLRGIRENEAKTGSSGTRPRQGSPAPMRQVTRRPAGIRGQRDNDRARRTVRCPSRRRLPPECRHAPGCDLGKPCVQEHPIYSTGANEPCQKRVNKP